MAKGTGTGALETTTLRLTQALTVLAGIAALGLAAHMVLDVCLRFFANAPIEGTIEYVTYWWMPVMVFCAMAITQHRGEHIDLPMLHERLPHRMRAVATALINTATLVFVGLIGWYGVENALAQTAVGEFTSATNTLVWPTRWIVPVGTAVLVLQLIVEIKHAVQAARGKETLTTQEEVNNGDLPAF